MLILRYVDDILVMHHDHMTILDKINGYMLLKPSSVRDPDIYLGAKLHLTRLKHGVWVWGLCPSKYLAQAIKNCENHLLKKLGNCYQLPSWADNPFPMDYCLKLDASNPLGPKCLSFYQHLIGVMRWMMELDRIDIATKYPSYPHTLPTLMWDTLRLPSTSWVT